MQAAAQVYQAGERFNPYMKFYGIFIPDAILLNPDLTHAEKICYGILARYNGRNNRCYPSQETIAENLCLSVRQTIRILSSLEAKRFIIRVIIRGKTHYHFLWHKSFDNHHVREKPRPQTHDTDVTDNDANVTPEPDTDVTQKETTNKEKEKTTTAPAQVVAVPSDAETDKICALISDGVTVTKGIRRIIRANLAKHGPDHVRRNILYTNANIRFKNKYKAYLDKCLRGDWGEDISLEAPPKKVRLEPGMRILYPDGNVYTVTRDMCFATPKGYVAQGTIRQGLMRGTFKVVPDE